MEPKNWVRVDKLNLWNRRIVAFSGLRNSYNNNNNNNPFCFPNSTPSHPFLCVCDPLLFVPRLVVLDFACLFQHKKHLFHSETAECCQLHLITQRLTHALIINLWDCPKEIIDFKKQLKASTKSIGNLTT